jgi:hypothetical protein
MGTFLVSVSDACIAARAGLIRALARDQLMQPCRQALTSIDWIGYVTRPRTNGMLR